MTGPDGQQNAVVFGTIPQFRNSCGRGARINRLVLRGPFQLAPPTGVAHYDWVSFACAMIRADVVRDVGILDEGFFLYYDDADYCRTVRKAGWKIGCCETARVVHLEGQSNELPEKALRRERKPRYYYVSRSRYFAKHTGTVGLWAANIAWTTGRDRRVHRLFSRRDDRAPFNRLFSRRGGQACDRRMEGYLDDVGAGSEFRCLVPRNPGSSCSAERGMTTSSVGAVVIGRNEGDRLRVCLESVLPHVNTTVYVDSGSVDGSMALATRLGAHTLELSSSIPFTAARARNVGWKRILELNPGIQYIHFVDGDFALVESWIGAAVAVLATQPETAVVCGHVREDRLGRNIYHRLAGMEWDTPVGLTKYCGGVAMVRHSALAQVGGFRDDLVAGEEPELCVRLRQAGWSIVKLDHEMASHDCDIDSFRLWWKRSIRSGRAYAEGAALHGAPPERHWVKETRSIWIWGVVIPILGVILAIPTIGVSLAIVVALYVLLAIKIILGRLHRQRRSLADASLYALACVVGKWPQAIGLLKYVLGKHTGRRVRLIEYDKCRSSEKGIAEQPMK